MLKFSRVLNDFNIDERHVIDNVSNLIVAFSTCF